MKAAKYSPDVMKLIDYQAMNAGSKKFRNIPGHKAKHQDKQWFTVEKTGKFDPFISKTCRCCDEGKTETIRHVFQCKSRAKIHEKKKNRF